MKRIIFVGALIIAASSFGLGQTNSGSVARNTSPEKEILSLERELVEAEQRRDTAAMERILAEDWIWTNFEGEVINRAQRVARIRNGARTVESQETEDVRVRVYRDAAVVTARANVRGMRRRDQPVNFSARYTRVYVRNNGRWQMVAQHSSRIVEQEPQRSQ